MSSNGPSGARDDGPDDESPGGSHPSEQRDALTLPAHADTGTRRKQPVLAPGTRLGHGRYVVGDLLGRGGMAEVYAAEHTALKSQVAIKLLTRSLDANPEFRERFVREGMAAAAIRHPHIVGVIDAGNDDEGCYLVLERLEGETFRTFTNRRGALPIHRAVDIALPVIAALGVAHRAGIIHRDIKPENIFVTRDAQGRPFPKLLDFGISKLALPGLTSLTQASAILGTPRYMSPEQARGESDIDGATDQFSIAMVLFEAVTGTMPYESTTPQRLLLEVARGLGPRAVRGEPALGDLRDPLERALETDPASRFATIGDFGAALAPFASPRLRSEWGPIFEGRRVAHSLLPASPVRPADTGRSLRSMAAETLAAKPSPDRPSTEPRARKPAR